MKSLIARKLAVVALVALAGACLVSCGVRTAVSAESDWEEQDSGPKLMPCGYGPPCNPRNFGGQSCTSLGLKPGALSCDPKTCFLVLTGCGRTPGGGAGTSGGSVGPGAGSAPLFGAQPMDAGPLFGGLFGAQPGAGMTGTPGTTMPGAGAMPGGTPMDDEDGGTPGFFGNGFFGGNPGQGFFGGNFFGGGQNANNAEADDPGQ